MNFKNINESFERKYRPLIEALNIEQLDQDLSHIDDGEVMLETPEGIIEFTIPGFEGGLDYENYKDTLMKFKGPITLQATNRDTFNDIEISLSKEQVEEIKNNIIENIEDILNDEEYNFDESLKSKLEEALNRLNEAEISDEDKHDSDLIRSMIDKMNYRSNAAFTPEEKAVMSKYGIDRNNNTKSLSVGGRNLNRDVDTMNKDRYFYNTKGHNNGNEKKINYADRARKLPQRKDSQIFTGPWTVDNDQINTHGYNRTNLKGLQDAERYAQDIPMRDKVRDMKDALRDRKWAQSSIDNADSERDRRMAKAQADYDKAVADADKHYKWDTEDSARRRDYAQGKIDKLLKRDKDTPLDEGLTGRYAELGIGQARLDIIDRCENLGVWEELFRDFLDHMTDQQVYDLAKAGDWLYTDED